MVAIFTGAPGIIEIIIVLIVLGAITAAAVLAIIISGVISGCRKKAVQMGACPVCQNLCSPSAPTCPACGHPLQDEQSLDG